MPLALALDAEHFHHAPLPRSKDGAVHPESPRRLEAITAMLAEAQLRDTLPVPVTEASEAALAGIHPPEYLQRLMDQGEAGGGWLDEDTYATPHTFRIARRAVGGLLGVVDAVLEGRADNGFAFGRPPGHHALADQAMGFCLLAGAAIAADHARRRHGAGRVLIIDWDVHHGNGTQELCYRDPDVLFFDLHQEDLWPYEGAVTETGAGPGAGTTVNVPLPAGAGDAAALDAVRRLLFPLAARFRPDLVIVSAGFDAHADDPVSALAWTPAGFGELMTAAMEIADRWCGRRLVATLEGGYAPPALAASAEACLRRMLDPCAALQPAPDAPPASFDVRPLLADLRALHRVG